MADDFKFDEKAHLYTLDGKPMTGCTTILGVLAKPALIPWAARMATEYVHSCQADFLELIPDEIGDTYKFSYDNFKRVLEDAKNAHRKKKEDAATKGTDLHALVEEWVRWCIEKYDGNPVINTLIGGPECGTIKDFCNWAVKENIRFIATEQRLYSKELWVAGTCDLIFEKDGKRYVGDIKTYKKIWDRVPLIQCAGYALMWEEMHREAISTPSIHVGPKIDGYCVICLPKERTFNEAEDVLWSWDTDGDRDAFLAAVKLYRYLQK